MRQEHAYFKPLFVVVILRLSLLPLFSFNFSSMLGLIEEKSICFLSFLLTRAYPCNKVTFLGKKSNLKRMPYFNLLKDTKYCLANLIAIVDNNVVCFASFTCKAPVLCISTFGVDCLS